MSTTLQGKRIDSPFAADGELIREWPSPGDYYHIPHVGWRGVTPNGLDANFATHVVEEHSDRTITVAPSIFVNEGREPSWHGYLERGIWREC